MLREIMILMMTSISRGWEGIVLGGGDSCRRERLFSLFKMKVV
jgi:hypothetical protein